MDTDDLSRETYLAIMIEAERFNHDLTLRFGLLSDQCKDEHEFIDKSIRLIDYIRKGNLTYFSNIFFGTIPDLQELNEALDRITKNILKVQRIPFAKRHFDF